MVLNSASFKYGVFLNNVIGVVVQVFLFLRDARPVKLSNLRNVELVVSWLISLRPSGEI